MNIIVGEGIERMLTMKRGGYKSPTFDESWDGREADDWSY